MELHHLRCAVAIADYGSFTDAAAALHLSQPALSYTISRLERELGTRLFDRTPAGSRLTATGAAFIGPARRALQEASNGKAAVDAVTGVLTGDLRIVGIRTAIVETAQLAARFNERHPGVRIVVEEPTRDPDVVELIRKGRCDIGIIRSSEQPDDLRSVAAGSRDIVAIIPETHAVATRWVTLKSLTTIPFVAPLPGTADRAAHEAFFRETGTRPPIAAECSNLDTIFELVRGGIGAAFTSSSRAASMNLDGIAVRPLRPRRGDELSAICTTTASPAAEAFCALIGDGGVRVDPHDD
jgi:DNA-binding transcriptional LysR family regulator